MSRRAAAISLQGGDKRLPVPRPATRSRSSETPERDARPHGDGVRARAPLPRGCEHELQTPLAILRAELEIALRRPRSREELEDVVRSRAGGGEPPRQAGRGPARRRALGPGRAACQPRDDPRRRPAGERVRALRAPGPRRGSVDLDRDEPGLQLRCDPIRIGQALGNPIDNSLRYGAGDITLAARTRASVVELHVRDDGGGFPAAFLPRAFERFSRADHARSGPCSGLGLAIVQAIARAHGGDANVANRAGGGSDVWLAPPRRS